MIDVIEERTPALDAGSLQDRLRSAREEIDTNTIHELPLPIRFTDGSLLVAKYRTLGWRERRKIGLAVKGPDLPAAELSAAAETLVQSCTGVDAHVDGEVKPLGQKLGAQLAAFLGEDGAETDQQGIFLIFPGDLAVMRHVEALSVLQAKDIEGTEDEIAKN